MAATVIRTSDPAVIARALQIKLWTFKRRLAFTALRGFIEKTPVDTGNARAGWSIGAGTSPEYPPDTDGRMTKQAATQAAWSRITNVGKTPPGGDPYSPIVIGNRVKYITVLEFGRADGSPGSRQAPYGMVRVTIQEMNETLERALGAIPED